MRTKALLVSLKKWLLLLVLPVLATCLGSCSKDENEPVVPEQQDLHAIAGTWYFKEPLRPDNGLDTGEFFCWNASTRSVEVEDPTYTQEINITTDGRFNWVMIKFYPNTWLYDKQCWGENTVTEEVTGKVELTDTKLSFYYDQWFRGTPGISFEYELSDDNQNLLLIGKTDGFQPITYKMKFNRIEKLHF